jgi:tetratricopeptide (TPR) repeat protein
METPKNQNSPKVESVNKPKEVPAPVLVAPMFRSFDWLAMAMAFAAVWTVYLFTLAPQVTLEDSGELCTGSFYAGIPHPPGYPFWAIYSWIWTVIVPFGNVAWRVEVGQSFAAAMGCGLLALMVSRGSSMLIEGIEELRTVSRKWENAICVVSGVVAATLLGLGHFMWKESIVVNRISVFGVPWLLFMISLLMRWMYAPQQRRYLYAAMFVYGLIATIHQSLILSAVGVEILICLVLPRLGRDLFLVNSIIYLIILYFMGQKSVPALNAMTNTQHNIFHLVGIGSILTSGWLGLKFNQIATEWKSVLIMGLMWLLAVCVYFYMPISGMTCPPMQWGYPRTVEGFFHALSRGQYGSAEGVNVFQDPSRFAWQLWYLAKGLSESFSWVYMFIGLLPFVFLMKMHKRERNWIIGITAIYLHISVLLVIIFNVTPDRSTSELLKVFFTASHALFAMMIGYGLTILAAYIATSYEKFRRWGFIGGVVALVLAIFCLVDATGKLFYGPAGEVNLFQLPHHIALAFDKDQFGLPVFSNLILVALPIMFLTSLFFYRKRGPVLILLAIFAVTPLCSGLNNWYKCEQRNHWFGYWFGHDMFTPPFKDPKTGQLSYDNELRKELLKDPKNAKAVYPEMARDTILFGGTDPGRFCPTYIIFCESLIPHNCQPLQDQKFDRRDVYIITQNALADGTYLQYLRSQYNRSKQQDPPFFSRFFRYVSAIALGQSTAGTVIMDGTDKGSGNTGNSLVEGVCSLLDKVLDQPLTAHGKRVENARRAEGVYPPKEIYIPSLEDSQMCFAEYARRKQINPQDGKVEISGQVDVMNINGLLCKVIFDQNPTNEFYIEESFPLDWMYPYETPFGVIMKINRQPVTELSQEVMDLDHKFWSDYSTRLCGNWITYDTSIQQICDFVEQTYIRNNYKGYIGSRAFVRDDDGQKAFSKLRSSQAGMYAWRVDQRTCPPEFRQKSAASQEALRRETDFAFKQAFAFCPYSPEAVYRYINFLLPYGRFDDAILVAKTCQKLDPYNDQITGLVKNLEDFKRDNAARTQAVGQLETMEKLAKTNPENVQNLVMLGGTLLMQLQQTNRAIELFDQALARPEIKFNDVAAVAQYFAQLGNYTKLESALKKMVEVAPDQPEPRYDLSALQAMLGRSEESLTNLRIALATSAKQRATNPAAHDLLAAARMDGRFNTLRAQPEFQKLVPPQ